MASNKLELFAVPGLPMVEPGDDLCAQILTALENASLQLQQGDIIVVAQKIISKAEDRYVVLDEVEVSSEAREWAGKVDKEPALVQLILDESVEVIRHRPGAMIVEHRLGYVHANAGIDRSNIEHPDGRERALLLPLDANASAARLRQGFERSGNRPMTIGVIVSDSAGRAWRNGITGFAIGSAGVPPIRCQVGDKDLFGRTLEITETADIDELASAASLLMGQGGEGNPVVIVRGWQWQACEDNASSLIRSSEQDLFR